MDKFILNLALVLITSAFTVLGITINKLFFIGTGLTYFGLIIETVFSTTNKYLLNI